MKRKFDFYLKDILEAIDRITKYTSGMDFEEFGKQSLVIDAVLRNLEIIGEAATQLPADYKEKHKSTPWRDIEDFRIVVAHHYWKINFERIWDILENKLEPLRQQVEAILDKS